MGMNVKTGQLLAVKQINIATADDEKNVGILQNEIEVLAKLQHPHIVSFYGSEKVNNRFNILMEYVPGKSLAAMLEDFGALSEKTMQIYTHQLVDALDYMHKKDIVHRDLKAKNILIHQDGQVNLRILGVQSNFPTTLLNAAPSVNYTYTPLDITEFYKVPTTGSR
eukprot:TRINITY_DN13843_c0_g1_i1.p1 TRINITY_DN13843_c0_g1~~TRINITY_DN13843_c0_g1_i1.p1  ORF type:complete len:166 (-),score=27.09 TRINITY_DN13843_c0_g1_i1:216-713(-)